MTVHPDLANAPTFIETQFPVSRLSKESYKERKANYSQTLTGLGKWWGRKPLIVVRAVILGLLMPASGDPRRDREVFLALLTMDEEGLRRRKSRNIPLKEVYRRLADEERGRWFTRTSTAEKPKLKANTAATKREARQQLQALLFERMSYDEKLRWCDRPEHLDGPAPEAWQRINAHLGTGAESLPALVRELGERRFGHAPRVGDAFCGGGSVPFEAARIGCEAYGSDLNPVAALLTWGALNIVGGGAAVAKQVRQAQEAVFEAVDAQVTEWGIEHDERGWRADAFLYCTETTCPECGWRVPLAPSWVIGEKTRTVARLRPDAERKRFHIDIHQGESREALRAARAAGTVRSSRLVCPNCQASTPMAAIRGDQRGGGGRGYGLRQWQNEDLVPRAEDVFQERLYCVRWRSPDDESEAEYRAVGEADLQREAEALRLLEERLVDWRARGYIPSRAIVPGRKTDELMQTRGWTHWHHLFTPRQLLVHGLLAQEAAAWELCTEARVACVLGMGRVADWDCKLSRWHPHSANEKSEQAFSNQALNTLESYAGRSLTALLPAWTLRIQPQESAATSVALASDARTTASEADIWITDPPYADAINYHELSEFFIAWYNEQLPLPAWYPDSKRALAVQGVGADFRRNMVDSYRNLANHMPDNGLQVVMFTHQDAAVWADLTLILWAAGLRVTAAWTIATETDSALKEGNYVQGTVLMVLRKQASEDTAFLDEVVPEVEAEVERQLASMTALDDRDDPNFTDADYQLAAYAAALRVLTGYRAIDDVDVAQELARERRRGEANPIERIIADAVRTASNYLVPSGLPSHVWRGLTATEKLYLKGLDVERHGDFRAGVYQEFARGFGVQDYAHLLHTGKANQTRLKTATEFARADQDGTLVRHALYATWRAAETGDTTESLTWLRTELPNYHGPAREHVATVLRYLATMDAEHWQEDATAARLVAGAVENDHV